MNKPSRDEILKLAGGPAVFATPGLRGPLVTIDDPLAWRKAWPNMEIIALYTEAQALALAAAMYAAGEEGMRERVRNLALIEAHLQHDLDVARNPKNAVLHSPDSAKWQKMAALIAALPITTSTEGEQ